MPKHRKLALVQSIRRRRPRALWACRYPPPCLCACPSLRQAEQPPSSLQTRLDDDCRIEPDGDVRGWCASGYGMTLVKGEENVLERRGIRLTVSALQVHYLPPTTFVCQENYFYQARMQFVQSCLIVLGGMCCCVRATLCIHRLMRAGELGSEREAKNASSPASDTRIAQDVIW